MQENITTSIPVSSVPKPIQQADIEQDYNFFQAQKVAENMLELGLISLSEFNKLSLKNRETFSPFWVEIMPEIR
ncbi:SHOCT domain-containing protein [Anaerotignum faecicola]